MMMCVVIMLIHTLLIIARIAGIIHISWLIIFLPEIVCLVLFIALTIIGVLGAIRDHRRRKTQ